MRYQLRDYQTKAIDAVRAKIRQGSRRVILVSPTGCHAPGQHVLMFDGTTKAVEDIRVDDCLMGPDSNPRVVSRLIRGAGDMYRVIPVKGNSWVVSSDHVLTLVRSNDGSKSDGEVIDISVRDWLKWPAFRRSIYKLFRSPVNFRSVAPRGIEPYFLGLLLGDGCLCFGRVEVSTTDSEIVVELCRQASIWKTQLRVDSSGGRCPSYHFTLNQQGSLWANTCLLENIRSLGIAELRSGEKYIPYAYKIAPREARLDVLAGLLDTDGSLSRNGYDYVSKSSDLAEDVAFVSRSLGLAAYVHECVKTCQTGVSGTYYRVSISGNTDMIPCRIKRKQANSRGQKKSALRTGITIEPARSGEFFGFTIDGDGRYLLDDFTVTHNSGKTLCSAAIIESAVAKGSRVLFLAHRVELLQQCSDKLDSFGINHGIIKAKHWRTCPSAKVQVASIQTLVRREKPPADLVVIDECHRALAPTYFDLATNHYPGSVLLGLTATPWRTSGEGLGRLYDSMVVTAQIKELVAAGYLIAPRVFAPTRPDLAGVHTVAGDYKQDELAKAVDKSMLVGDIVNHWLRLASGRRTVVFAASVEHSKHIAECFRTSGVAAEHVDGEMDEQQRTAIIDRLKSGETTLVSNCDLISEGVDIPILSCCVLARPTKSSMKYLQMVGRIERPCEGKADAIILDHAGCCWRHGFPTDDRVFTLEDQRPPKDPEDAPVKVCSSCFAVMPAGSRVCPECGAEQTPVRRERQGPDQVDGELAEIVPGDLRTCRKCRSTETHTFSGCGLGAYTTGLKCRACGAVSFVTDHLRARGAGLEEKRAEYERLEAIREKKGFAAGWVAHRYRALFGVWPRGMKTVSA